MLNLSPSEYLVTYLWVIIGQLILSANKTARHVYNTAKILIAMTLTLPQPIALYITAQNAFQVEELVQQFAEDAVVLDEGHTYKGAKAIADWNHATNEKYHTQMTPVEGHATPDGYDVKISMAGTFPGSPVVAGFSFVLAYGKITRLTVE